MGKEAALARIRKLVSQYEDQREEYRSDEYLESEVRSDFLDPFFRALGWDVDNEAGRPLRLREVKQEASVETKEGGTKKPDYEFRDGYGNGIFYVEAKRPGVSVDSVGPALQTRQYGWTANLPVSFLTNFEKLVVYDCSVTPEEGDQVHTARIRTYEFTDYVEKFEEIYSILSRDQVMDGALEDEFGEPSEAVERKTFDEVFLEQLEGWRTELAENIVSNNPDISQRDLNYFVHRLLNRIIFLRIAEDRDLETHERLKSLDDYSYSALEEIFEDAEDKYNSDLFDLVDEYSSENLTIDADALGSVLEDLYYPNSPYTFAVVESDIIGRIYDLFLGKELRKAGDSLDIVEKPEVLHSQGAVTTPEYIVDEIVSQSVEEELADIPISELGEFSVADICCGSGVFLTSAFEILLEKYRELYLKNSIEDGLEEVADEMRLTFEERRNILEEHVFGVDIDPLAVEVTRFNLMLKLLEDQPTAQIDRFASEVGPPLLPRLGNNIHSGNSLVDLDFYREYDTNSGDSLYQVNPFNFDSAFSDIMDRGGFNAIIGNPPYIRIQKMREYTSDDEVEYYDEVHGYHTASRDNYDKYALFVERGLELLKEGGSLGFIIPQKFLNLKSGRQLREVIAEKRALSRLVHFGVDQVFQHHRNYTCLLFLKKGGVETYRVEKSFDLEDWILMESSPDIIEGSTENLDGESWAFVEDNVEELFSRIEDDNPYRLGDVADIFVGLQTSRNDVYFLRNWEFEDGFVHFTDKDGKAQKVEEELVRKLLHTTNKWKHTIYPMSKAEATYRLIYPYDENGDVIPPDTLESEYPEAWCYFCEHEEVLRDRDLYDCDVDAFYRYGRDQGFGKLDEEKIVIQVLSLEPRYALDDEGIYNTAGGNGPFYNVRRRESVQRKDGTDENLKLVQDNRYLLAILSHPVIEAMVRSDSSFFRDGYYSHGKQYIEDIPVKAIDEENEEEVALYSEIVDEVERHLNLYEDYRAESVESRKQTLNRRMTALRESIQDKISSLYDLSADEVEIAESV